MVVGSAEVTNAAGIHVRPSGIIFVASRSYEGSIVVTSGEKTANPAGVIGLIALGLARGDEVEISVSGPDEEEKLSELQELFAREFDFPPRA